MKIIIDSRMRQVEKRYLSQFGTLIELSYQDIVYDEISSHPDIFFCKINNTLFHAPNVKINSNFGIPGQSNIEFDYPNDIKYNICQIGNSIIHNYEYTDLKILKYINDNGLKKINVSQGYTKCNICPTSDISCITSDLGIHNSLKSNNIDSLLLEGEIIFLLDKNGFKTNMKGFIGGATAIIDNTFIIFGDINKLKNKTSLINHINKYNLKIKDFKNLDIIDYGSIITFD